MLEESKKAQRASGAIVRRTRRWGRVAAIACSWFVLLAFGEVQIHVGGAVVDVRLELHAEAAVTTVMGRQPIDLPDRRQNGRGDDPAGVVMTQCRALV